MLRLRRSWRTRGPSARSRSPSAPSTRWRDGSPPSGRWTTSPAYPCHPDRMRPTRVVFVLVPKVHLLDLAGPAQVFTTANDLGYGYQVRYVAEAEEIAPARGVPLRARLGGPELGRDARVGVRGGRSRGLPPIPPIGPETRQRLRDHHAAGGTVASVC